MSKLALMPAVLAAGLSGHAAAMTSSSAEIVKRPPPEAVAAAWPEQAKAQHQGGRAIARCQVSVSGVLSGCSIVSEWPSAMGFGPALLALTPKYEVKAASLHGKPVESQILIDAGWNDYESQPEWIRKPTPEELLAVYPKGAIDQGLDGDITLSCLVTVQGALTACVALRENPPGVGFGLAAVMLTPRFLLKPAQRDGRPVVVSMTMPLHFRGFGEPRGMLMSSHAAAPAAMVWPTAPSVEDLKAAYPEHARQAKIAGRAVLLCEFTAEGRLDKCGVSIEDPPGEGFAAAAKKLIGVFRAVTKTSDGTPLNRFAVQIPITFDPAMLGDGPPPAGRPVWAALPTAEEVQAAIASAPKDLGSVRVTLSCTVAQGGILSRCRVASEAPAAKGFGAAALQLAPAFRIKTWTDEGLPVVGVNVNVPIRFETGEPIASQSPPPSPAR